LTHASGDVAAAERALVIGALEAAIAERRSTPRAAVEAFDDGEAGAAGAAWTSHAGRPLSC
jgi:hypothetical protein